MNSNIEIYIVGSAVLFFLIIVFFYIRKISNSQELKVKIESLQDPLESSNLINEDNSNASLDNDTQTEQDQKLVIFNLISSDKSFFNIPQLFGFLSNCGAKLNNGFFSFYDEKNNKIWIHEHGPRGGDEINIIEAGENYGWPLASYGINYIGTKFTDKTSIDGMVDPIHFWVPSIAPSGMVYVDNPNYPSLNQSILIGSLKFQYLHQCVIKDGKVVEEKKLFDQIGRVRSVELDKDKNIFVGVENLGIIKLIE